MDLEKIIAEMAASTVSSPVPRLELETQLPVAVITVAVAVVLLALFAMRWCRRSLSSTAAAWRSTYKTARTTLTRIKATLAVAAARKLNQRS
jgi:uncharacterized protein HemY